MRKGPRSRMEHVVKGKSTLQNIICIYYSKKLRLVCMDSVTWGQAHDLNRMKN